MTEYTLKNIFLFTAIAGWLFVSPAVAQDRNYSDYTHYVDPFIGSGGHGHVFVGANVPFGAVQAGPENFYKGWDWCSGYNYRDSVLIGFSQTHLSGTGIGDLSDVLIMPYTGDVKLDKGVEAISGSGYASHFSHRNETAQPGYYAVKLDNSGIGVELTATERVGFHQYHFPQGKPAHVIIDLKEGINDASTDTYIEQVDAHTFKGYRFSKGWAKNQMLFFAIKTSAAVNDFTVYDGKAPLKKNSGRGLAIKGLISFANPPAILQLKVGISPVSADNALANIQAEIPGWDFNRVRAAAKDKWNRELAKIDIRTKQDSDKRIFYTALYHTMIDPALFDDYNGTYRGADKKIYPNPGYHTYTVFSLWDTYRAENPLFVLTQPKRVADMVNTMLAISRQQGRLPMWHLMANETGTMVGIASRQVIAEAYLKGVKGFNYESAYKELIKTSMIDTLGMQYVKNFRPIPTDKESRPVAKGMEYAIGDGSISLMARQMGKVKDYNYFAKRAQNCRDYFDSSDQFFKGVQSDGTFSPGFNAMASKNPFYAEGNAWQYLWLVPQDVPGLIKLLGGETMFNKRLDQFFQLPAEKEGLDDLTGLIGQYAHGNEPSHHIAYLYAYTGQQWKTAEKVRFILTHFYPNQPDGIIGNEDCGQMSAWYIFSSLGFYPVFPASLQYVIGSPLFDKATIRLPNGKHFSVTAINNKKDHPYIRMIMLNGKPYHKSFITHNDLMNGGDLVITMSKTPNYSFGQLKENRPH